MAKDDYYVIVYKLLAYLYLQLKGGEPVEERMVSNESPLFKINESYWRYIIKHLYEDGYIEGISITKIFGKGVVFGDLQDMMITPKGIDYLCNNSLFEKAKDFLRDIKDITPFI